MLFLSLFKFFERKYLQKLNKFSIKNLDCYIVSDLRFLLEIQDILPETSPFLYAWMAVLSTFFQMFIVLGMYNFGQTKKKHFRPMVQSHFEWRILRFPCGGYSEASMFRFHYYLHTKKCFEIYNQASQWNFIFQMIFLPKPCLKKSCSKTCSWNNLKFFCWLQQSWPWYLTDKSEFHHS